MKNTTVFVCTLLAVVGIGVAAIGAFNYAVDPYGIYQGVTLAGLDRMKSDIHINSPASKIYAVSQIQPRGIILGTSRAELALDPGHPGWSSDSAPRFNLALPVSSIATSRKLFNYANRHLPLKQVVVALDYAMFQLNRRGQDEFHGELLDKYGSTRKPETMRLQAFYTLFSYDALSASIDTLRFQRERPRTQARPETPPQPSNEPKISYLHNGQRDEAVLHESQQRFGHHKTFNRMLRKMKRQQLLNLRAYSQQPGLEAKTSAKYMGEFRALVRTCFEHSIDLRLFISPIHADYLALLDRPEDGGRYSRWIADLTRIVDEENREHADAKPVLLRDFSGFNTYTSEQVPPRGDLETEMQWYWEASHYKKALGDIVLDVVFSDKQVPKFGRIISKL